MVLLECSTVVTAAVTQLISSVNVTQFISSLSEVDKNLIVLSGDHGCMKMVGEILG
jgi:hypothetical protein